MIPPNAKFCNPCHIASVLQEEILSQIESRVEITDGLFVGFSKMDPHEKIIEWLESWVTPLKGVSVNHEVLHSECLCDCCGVEFNKENGSVFYVNYKASKEEGSGKKSILIYLDPNTSANVIEKALCGSDLKDCLLFGCSPWRIREVT